MHQLQEDREQENEIETAKREANLLQQVFEAQMGVDYAYDGMVLIYVAARTRVLRSMGVESVEEVLDAGFPPRFPRKTLCDLRALTYFNDALNAPLRQRAVAEQEMSHRKPRRSGLLLEIPKELMKVPHGPYRITLAPGADGGGYDRSMWHLYSMTGGIREQLLDGAHCRRLYVNDMRAGNVVDPYLKHSSVSRMMKRVLKLGALELGIDPAGFKPLGKNKFFRHAVASYLVPRNKIYQVVTLLHHQSDRMIRLVYANDDGTTTMAELRAGAGAAPGSTGNLQGLVEQFGDDPETLLRVLKAAGFIQRYQE